MKKPLLFAIPVFALLFSCSVEENVADETLIQKNVNAYAEGLSKSWENLNIDFSKLFDYKSMQNASEETKRAFSFITKDVQEELAKRPETDHAYVSFYLYNGKAGLETLFFGNSNKGVFTECQSFHKFGLRPYVYFVGDAAFYSEDLKFKNENCLNLDPATDKGTALENYTARKLSKEDGIAEFVVYVDATSSKIYGYKDL